MLPIILAIRDERDRNYVADIYEKHKKKLFVAANDILKNEEDAYDCVQDVVLILIDYLQSFQEWDEGRQKGFLLVCCKNLAKRSYNKRTRQNKYEFSTTDPETRADIDVEDKDSDIQELLLREATSKLITKCIKSMPPKYGDLLLFKYYFGMKNIDIAKMLGEPNNTINSRIMRAKAELKELLIKEGYSI